MSGWIELSGLEVLARHGVLPEESERAQRFLVDLRLHIDLEDASHSDDLAATVDYGVLASRVHHALVTERWNLIERLAGRVLDLVFEDPRVTEAEVVLHKPDAPIPHAFRDVAVRLHRTRGRRFYLALGSNLGDRLAHLRTARKGLAAAGVLAGAGHLYETAPVGGPAQGPYLNSVLALDTHLEPEALLEVARRLEVEAQRVRRDRWGPRTLDVDILWGEGVVRATDELTIPHARMADRGFVLAPLADLAPDLLIPGHGKVADLLDAVRDHVASDLGEW